MGKIIDLNNTELQNINGGGEGWKTLGYYIGIAFGFLEDVHNDYAHTPEGQAVQQALKDFQ